MEQEGAGMNNSIHAPGASWETIKAARARREACKQKPGPKPKGEK